MAMAPEPLLLPARALIRHALCRVLSQGAACSALFGDRLYPNRTEHWQASVLPACGVFALAESPLESDASPDPQERRLSLEVEILAQAGQGPCGGPGAEAPEQGGLCLPQRCSLDDNLDILAAAVEKALTLDAIGEAMGAIVNERRAAAGKPPLEKSIRQGERRWPCDALLLLKLTSLDLGIAVDGEREIGVAALSFDLEYGPLPLDAAGLDDFLLASTSIREDFTGRVELPAASDPIQGA